MDAKMGWRPQAVRRGLKRTLVIDAWCVVRGAWCVMRQRNRALSCTNHQSPLPHFNLTSFLHFQAISNSAASHSRAI